jgi:thymidylate synthase
MRENNFRNATYATIKGIEKILKRGSVVTTRGSEVSELRNHISIIERPQERVIILPHRRNNIFSTIAETIWVLGGRSDMKYLSHYLPRAQEFSDDGETWHGGYGPRLRRWGQVDQLSEVRRLITEESSTRRAVINLFNPETDYINGKDIPCNNWLHFLARDDRLHLNIALRSNDVIWGFSGINAFEWSVLHEMMSYWTATRPGQETFFASSFHLYPRHYVTARKMIDDFSGCTCYDFGLSGAPFKTSWSDFDDTLKIWFEIEANIRHDPDEKLDFGSCMPDPFLLDCLNMLRLYNGFRKGWGPERIGKELSSMPETDFTAAAYEFFGRANKGLLEQIAQPNIRAFFAHRKVQEQRDNGSDGGLSTGALIVRLHREKDAAYGKSWKKRGEQISILANIARKIDRLEVFMTHGSELEDETIFDTAVDLFVYLIKYRLFLLEGLPLEEEKSLPANAKRPLSDFAENFDLLVHGYSFQLHSDPFITTVRKISKLFEEIYAVAPLLDDSARLHRLCLAVEMAELAERLIGSLRIRNSTVRNLAA